MQSMLAIGSGTADLQLIYAPIFGAAEVGVARGFLATVFLTDTSHEWYLSVDCDMQFEMRDIERLVGRNQKLIGGYYHKRLAPKSSQPVLNTLDGKPFDPKISEVQEVLNVGTGFMLIHRSVFEQLRKAYPEIQYTDESGRTCWHFFPNGVYDGIMLSCDWAICHLWRNIGGKVFVDCGRKLPHHGKAVY